MSNYESGMGTGTGTDATAAPESGMGASEGYTTGAAEQGMGASEGYTTSAQEQGMGASEGYQTGAPESGMGASEGGAAYDSTNDYGLGSGRQSDQKEGKVGKFFDKVKDRLTKPHENK